MKWLMDSSDETGFYISCGPRSCGMKFQKANSGLDPRPEEERGQP
jgi:hypothetical protein